MNTLANQEPDKEMKVSLSPAEQAYVAILSERCLMEGQVLLELARAFHRIAGELNGCDSAEEVADMTRMMNTHYIQGHTKMAGVFTGLIRVDLQGTTAPSSIISKETIN